ncbi:MAG: ABC transporter permease [Alphaproteobacteria bacterium]|nr:ABC transporter permease [Alphaproteobacteria bacterium]
MFNFSLNTFFYLNPLAQRRLENFRHNKRGWWSFVIFMTLLFLSLFAEFIANDRPLVVYYNNHIYLPIFYDYQETDFGGDFTTSADYHDPYVTKLIQDKGWIIWSLIPYAYDTVIKDLPGPVPSPPSWQNWLGTDDQARDVLARLIYGFRISVLFGLALTFITTIIGILAGAIQGYFGGTLDLLFQRFLEIWGGLPTLYILLIFSSLIQPGFWTLLFIMMLFSWTWPIGIVRAEFLRARNFEYVLAAKALGVRNIVIIFRHLLPNAMVSTLTYLPFTLAGSVTTLTALDFLGLGMPVGSASLGDLLAQGKDNLQSPWLGITGFIVIGFMLSLVIFIGEAVRDAFDPRKVN